MATMTMFDVLPSPEFLDQIAYIRTARIIDAHGRGVDTSDNPIPFMAVVMPDGSNLDRLPDGSRLNASIRIWTQTLLTAGTKIDDTNSAQPDVVIWHGRRYVVKAVQDFDAFMGMGGGFIDFQAPVGGNPNGFFVVSCDLLPLNPTAGV